MGFEKIEPDESATPLDMPTALSAKTYVEHFQSRASHSLIKNVESEMSLIKLADREFPVSVNHGEYQGSYVSLPHSVYVLYAREELDLIDIGWMENPAKLTIAAADYLLKAIRINHIVQINNWLLSTNLHGDWNGEGIVKLRKQLTARFPDHYLGIRSIDNWSNPKLIQSLRSDGWILIPSRQIWVTDDMEKDWYCRNNVKNDRRALRKSGLKVRQANSLKKSEAERIAALYKMLYIDKYSKLNPEYTAQWIQLSLDSGLLKFRLACNADGQIMAAAGFSIRNGIATNPVLAYDTKRPQSEGLYRIACYLFGDYARQNKLRVNGSAGAAHFKSLRGARSEIEYIAFHADHLHPSKQLVLKAAASLMKAFVVPVMKNRML